MQAFHKNTKLNPRMWLFTEELLRQLRPQTERTMWIFEPHAAEQVFEDFIKENNIKVCRDEWLAFHPAHSLNPTTWPYLQIPFVTAMGVSQFGG